ncbi:MAG: Serine-pyruvate aminotransferase/archaeal aspartate aminotransferase [Anaerocolumna sp.]|jgi:aspartate aminotransferase-like enzyme|nr:Serine-pyruvate aminotransferase/archaeal aspartate aminotransferase [Anaerocolumna sp.]
MYKIMTPGPTMVRENVRLARSLETTNPDLDPKFYDYYKETCELISELLDTKNASFILSGEGILGLEAACASLTEPGDRALVIDNGIFGKGFADFVSIYGGIPVLYTKDYRHTIDITELEHYLEADHDFKYATIVHCDTPSGILNDIGKICPLLKKYGIITVVDSVSSTFGEEVHIDKSRIDILCGGSQKAVSAPPGLTFVTVSTDALHQMEVRSNPIKSFYANLYLFKDYYKNKWFPYTMPISDIYGLRTALENIKEDRLFLDRHKKIGLATRNAILKSGLTLYPLDGYSNTVTVINVPEGIKATDILKIMKDKYNILIAGAFDVLAGKVIRIGHMGENAQIEHVLDTLKALDETLDELKVPLRIKLSETFLQELSS